MPECHCIAGWICEEHPDLPWPHDDCCPGPGMRCENPECPWWHGASPAALKLDRSYLTDPPDKKPS